jgi:preprotein translocase subunit SecA
LFDYDSVINKQRQSIYNKRNQIIESENDQEKKNLLIQEIKKEIENNMSDIILRQTNNAQNTNQTTLDFINIINKEFSLKLDTEKLNDL